MSDTIKPEHERIKEESNYLRGKIKQELAEDKTHFTNETVQLLKFHGTYQQDDRDVRNRRRKEGKEPLYFLMVRSKIPGGKMTAEQYLAHDELANLYGNGTLRLTTRQGIQFHGVLKKNVKNVIKSINEKLGTTLGACGDVVRNVTACPAPSCDRLKLEIFQYAKAVSDQFLSHSGAYHEIWLNGERIKDEAPETEDVEPIYGKAYLPRKFKISIAFPEDNCVDVYTNDLGIVPEISEGKLTGFNILVGGGLGMSHGSKDTFPRLADPLCFVLPNELLDIAKAIVLVQRDHGDRKSRKHARMKYLIHDKGLEWFQAQVEKYFGRKLTPAHPIHWKGFENHLGWHEEGNGLWYFGVSIENGRIQDDTKIRLKSGLKHLVERFRGTVYLTANQDFIFSGIKHDEKNEVENILEKYAIPHPTQLSLVRKNAMACPALPTCGLAITESERCLPKLIDELEVKLKELGLENETITLRMTGCPNGCARPYSAEIGLVGKAVGTYNIYLGGNQDGTKLTQEFAVGVSENKIVDTLMPIFKFFKANRKENEQFGVFCSRVGMPELKQIH